MIIHDPQVETYTLHARIWLGIATVGFVIFVTALCVSVF